VDKLSSEETAYNTFQKINDSCTVNDPKYYGGDFQVQEDHGTSHTSVLAPNGDAVAVTSTVNLQ
jgi:gamma-glutamyltranspeptidase/glutathione hydrolase/leukotriene-C4 hydrolase